MPTLLTASQRQLLGMGWRRNKIQLRALDDFSITPANRAYLEGVAWNSAAVNTVAELTNQVPSRADYRRAVHAPHVLGVCAYFILALGGFTICNSLLPGYLALIAFVLLVLPLSIFALLISIIRQNRVDALTRRDEALVINRLLRVLELSELIKNDSTAETRRQLVGEIHISADLFYRRLGFVGWGVRGTDRKLRKSLARTGTAALRSYAPIAMTGGPEDIQRISVDFARAILRVGSGNWAEVKDLNPAASNKLTFTRFLPILSHTRELLAGVLIPLAGILVTAFFTRS
jgi:hypothetical protein